MTLSRKIFAFIVLLCLVLFCMVPLFKINDSWVEMNPVIQFHIPGFSDVKTKIVHWIVVTTVSSSPQDYINQLSTNLPLWNIVIVANHKTPSNLKCKKCFVLSVKTQNTSPFKIGKNSSPKNIGYLYAISRGAKFIYDTEESYLPVNKLADFWLAGDTTGLIYNGQQHVFDVYRHFGRSSIKQRGFPLRMKRPPRDNIFKLSNNFKTPLIQHALINGDPDIDEIIKMALSSKTIKANKTFDERTPPVVIPKGVMAPYNSKNTLFLADAFWALLLPVTSFESNRDIARSYWGQRLLWEIGGTVGFFPPNMFHQHAVNGEWKSGFFKSSRLVEYLLKWKCPESFQFVKCVEKLSEDLMEERLWSKEDYILVKNWLIDLKTIGYKFPDRSQFTTVEKNDRNVVFSPSVISEESAYSSKWKQVIAITNHCKDKAYQVTSSSMRAEPLSDILLIVVFNTPYYNNIPHINLIYSVTFDHIVYCGDDFKKFQKTSKSFPKSVTFIAQSVDNGYSVEKCISVAMKLNHKVTGYLLIGDDTLLNSWNIRKFPKDKPWFHGFVPMFRDRNHPWHWWQTGVGRQPFNKAWAKLTHISTNGSITELTIVKNYMQILKNNTGSDLGVYHCPSDIVYIPYKYRDTYILINDVYSQFNIFLEIAIPTVIAGLCPLNQIVELKGQYLWYDGKRNKIPQYFKKDEVFIHPVKLSQIQTSLKPFFCQTLFPLLVSGHKNSTKIVPYITGPVQQIGPL
ncbi:hypothetical protein LOTGIDRAFT_157830 [Lottia gigantea]|uniref:Uncharacterized protein n=1 Tax=Lottia gigantea TaxID=225164 RepID=V4A992_LOTGI|nr:hypothetical protein LOTGIDRAFT_157830 [Lottia gigantea]ESP00554.1 hypothetical protein LOTGIDRAFT_157830 [Lottia gigantea]